MADNLLSVEDLSATYRSTGAQVLDELSFRLDPGETRIVFGGCGSGKTTLARVLCGLVDPDLLVEGSVTTCGFDPVKRSAETEAALARSVAYIGADPLLGFKLNSDIASSYARLVSGRDRISHGDARNELQVALEGIGAKAPSFLVDRLPHELSRGALQQLQVCFALAKHPQLLVIDALTSGLDALSATELMDALSAAQKHTPFGLILLTRDPTRIAQLGADVLFLEDGRFRERISLTELSEPNAMLSRQSLLGELNRPVVGSIPPSVPPPSLPPEADRDSMPPESERDSAPPARAPEPSAVSERPLLHVERLSQVYRGRRGFGKMQLFSGLDSLSLYVRRGQTLGVIGETGCGKSTLALTLLRLLDPSYGRAYFDSNDLARARPGQVLEARRKMQLAFQDPLDVMDPNRTVRESLREALTLAKSLEDPAALLERVGLDHSLLHRYPAQLCSGEIRWLTLARSLALKPKLLICDDATAELDPAERRRLLELLIQLQLDEQLTLLFLSHDLHAVRALSQRVAVMFFGRIVEVGPTESLFKNPFHPYSRTLLDSTPELRQNVKLRVISEGHSPDPRHPPEGCAFAMRCPKADAERCAHEKPVLSQVGDHPRHRVACWYPLH